MFAPSSKPIWPNGTTIHALEESRKGEAKKREQDFNTKEGILSGF